jgi:hypothetical protein
VAVVSYRPQTYNVCGWCQWFAASAGMLLNKAWIYACDPYNKEEEGGVV